MKQPKKIEEIDFDLKPVFGAGLKAISGLFPSKLKKEKRKLEELKKRLELKKLQVEQERLLKELEKKEA